MDDFAVLEPVRIPTKPDADSDLKPDSIPRRSRTLFRSEAGHFQRGPCGSWRMISEPQIAVQGSRGLEGYPVGARIRLHGNRLLVRQVHSGGGHGAASRERARPPQRRSEGAACGPRSEVLRSRCGCSALRKAGAIDRIVDAIPQGFAAEFDAVGVVDDAVENGVGERGVADDVIPLRDGNLTGDHE